MAHQNFKLSRMYQIGFWGSVVGTVASLALLVATVGISNKALALCSTVGSSVAALVLRPSKSGVEDSSSGQTVLEVNSPQLYTSKWTMNEQPERGVLTGRATAFDFGDRVVIRQEEKNRGTYVLELKRVGESVTGVWWFYGGYPPQGMFRGSVSADDSIDATWQGPEGKGSGTWELTPEKTGERNE